jgi:hypothetical protein
MSSTWHPDLIVARRPSRGLALVSGAWAERTTRLAGVDRRYSQNAHGWVIPLAALEDVLAAASVDRLRVVERKTAA